MARQFLQINPNYEVLYQEQIFNIQIGTVGRSILFRLRWLEETNRWYFSFYNAQTNESYCTYIPLVASYDHPNDLLKPYEHKIIGHFYCIPKTDHPSSVDPQKDNLSEFYLIWSDTDGEE